MIDPVGRFGIGRGRLIRAVIVFSVTVALGAAPALASLDEGNGEIGVDFARARVDSDLIGRNGDRLTLRAGRLASDWLEWEGQATRTRVDDEPLPGTERRVTITWVMADVVFNFRLKKEIMPYILLGAGLAKTELEALGLSSSDTAAGYQVGGGSRFFIGKRSPVALRVEAVVLASDAFEHSYFHPSLSAGLTLRLGHAPAVSP